MRFVTGMNNLMDSPLLISCKSFITQFTLKWLYAYNINTWNGFHWCCDPQKVWSISLRSIFGRTSGTEYISSLSKVKSTKYFLYDSSPWLKLFDTHAYDAKYFMLLSSLFHVALVKVLNDPVLYVAIPLIKVYWHQKTMKNYLPVCFLICNRISWASW